MTKKITNITEYLMQGKIYRDYKKAEKAVDQKHLDAIITFTLRAIELDCEIGLALGEYADEKYLDIETPLFDKINNMYRDAAAGCYFCDKGVDPNARDLITKPRSVLCAG